MTDDTGPAWLPAADELRQILNQLPPLERRRILDYVSRPPDPPGPRGYPIRDCMAAARRVAELASAHPSWTRAHVRREVAREMAISTVVLRRMLAHVEQ